MEFGLPDVTIVTSSSRCSSVLSYNALEWSGIINSPNRLEPQEWQFLKEKESESEEVLEIIGGAAGITYRSTPSPQPYYIHSFDWNGHCSPTLTPEISENMECCKAIVEPPVIVLEQFVENSSTDPGQEPSKLCEVDSYPTFFSCNPALSILKSTTADGKYDSSAKSDDPDQNVNVETLCNVTFDQKPDPQSCGIFFDISENQDGTAKPQFVIPSLPGDNYDANPLCSVGDDTTPSPEMGNVLNTDAMSASEFKIEVLGCNVFPQPEIKLKEDLLQVPQGHPDLNTDAVLTSEIKIEVVGDEVVYPPETMSKFKNGILQIPDVQPDVKSLSAITNDTSATLSDVPNDVSPLPETQHVVHSVNNLNGSSKVDNTGANTISHVFHSLNAIVIEQDNDSVENNTVKSIPPMVQKGHFDETNNAVNLKCLEFEKLSENDGLGINQQGGIECNNFLAGNAEDEILECVPNLETTVTSNSLLKGPEIQNSENCSESSEQEASQPMPRNPIRSVKLDLTKKRTPSLMGPRPYHIFLESYTLRTQQQQLKIQSCQSISPTFSAPCQMSPENVDNSEIRSLETQHKITETSFKVEGSNGLDLSAPEILPAEPALGHLLNSQPPTVTNSERQTPAVGSMTAETEPNMLPTLTGLEGAENVEISDLSSATCKNASNSSIQDDIISQNSFTSVTRQDMPDKPQLKRMERSQSIDSENSDVVIFTKTPTETILKFNSERDASPAMEYSITNNDVAVQKNEINQFSLSLPEEQEMSLATPDVPTTVPTVIVAPVTKSSWHSEVTTGYSDEWLDPSDLWLKKMYSPELKKVEVEDNWSAKKFKKVRFQDTVERIPWDSCVENVAPEDGPEAVLPMVVVPTAEELPTSEPPNLPQTTCLVEDVGQPAQVTGVNSHGHTSFPYGCCEEVEALVPTGRNVLDSGECVDMALGADSRRSLNHQRPQSVMGSNLSRHSGKGMGRRAHSSGNLCHGGKLLSANVGRFLNPCGTDSVSPRDRSKLCGSLPTNLDDREARRGDGTPESPYSGNNNYGEIYGHGHETDVQLTLSKPGDQGYSSEKSHESSPVMAHLPSQLDDPYDPLLMDFPFITEDKIFDVVIEKGSRGLGLSVTGGVDTDDIYAGLIRIKRVFPHEPAWLCGALQPDDILLHANGAPLTGLTNYEALEVLRSTPNPVHLVVCRPSFGGFSQVPIGEPPPPPLRAPSSQLLHLAALTSLSINQYGEFDITLMKVNGSLGFTLRKEDESVLGHYVRALVREPALSDGRIEAGDKIVAVNGMDISKLSHEEAVQMLRKCDDMVDLRLYRDSAQTPVGALSPTEPAPSRRPALRKEAVDMLCHLAVRKQSPGEASPRRRRLGDHSRKTHANESQQEPKLERPGFLNLEGEGRHKFQVLNIDESSSLPPLPTPSFTSHNPLYQSDHSPAFSTHNPMYQSAQSPSPSPATTLPDLDGPSQGPKGLLKWKGVVFTPNTDDGEDSKDASPNTTIIQSDEGQILTVELIRGWNSRLGFSLQDCGSGSFISTIYADSVAAKDGRLRTGDRVLRINDEDTEGMATPEVIDLLRKIRGAIAITVLRPTIQN